MSATIFAYKRCSVCPCSHFFHRSWYSYHLWGPCGSLS